MEASMDRSIYKRISPKSNTIFRGDNLEIMRALPDECVDLIYIDPPFFTQRNYKNIWGDKESVQDYGADFFTGFQDTKDFFEKHIHSDAKGIKAYLEWMRARLVECHRILSAKGSFYLHLDYHAVHYVKVMLDEIFEYKNFRSEIIWRRSNPKGLASKAFPTSSDTILFYSKSKDFTWNPLFEPLSEDYIDKFYRHTEEKTGRRYRLGPLTNPNTDRPNLTYEWNGHKKVWRWTKERMKKADKAGLIEYSSSGLAQQKIYLDERKGRALDNIWLDIKHLQGGSTEKTGWPTQKPVALLERIISASSDENDVVFDCFAGCGTAMHAAHKLKRKWIGIDISPTAIDVNRERLKKLGAKVNVIDEHDLPVNLSEKKRREKLSEAG
jgi:site-specific DNA-methyltransferase (adenine-specific)